MDEVGQGCDPSLKPLLPDSILGLLGRKRERSGRREGKKRERKTREREEKRDLSVYLYVYMCMCI